MSYDVSSRRRGFRIPPQWIIAGILALVGVFQYFGRTQINPVTGEKQRVALSVEQEVALGLQSAPAMAAKMGGEVAPSSKAAMIVSEIGERLVC